MGNGMNVYDPCFSSRSPNTCTWNSWINCINTNFVICRHLFWHRRIYWWLYFLLDNTHFLPPIVSLSCKRAKEFFNSRWLVYTHSLWSLVLISAWNSEMLLVVPLPVARQPISEIMYLKMICPWKEWGHSQGNLKFSSFQGVIFSTLGDHRPCINRLKHSKYLCALEESCRCHNPYPV